MPHRRPLCLSSLKAIPVRLAGYGAREMVNVPIFLADAFNLLETKYAQTEGLFRKPGNTQRLKLMKYSFRSNYGIPETASAHDICDLVKTFFREIDEPLLTSGLEDQFVRFVSTISHEGTKRKIVLELCHVLPPRHKETLAFLMYKLKKLAEYSEENKMTVSNLATVMVPSIFREPVAQTSMDAHEALASSKSDIELKTQVLEILINNAEHIGILNEYEHVMSPKMYEDVGNAAKSRNWFLPKLDDTVKGSPKRMISKHDSIVNGKNSYSTPPNRRSLVNIHRSKMVNFCLPDAKTSDSSEDTDRNSVTTPTIPNSQNLDGSFCQDHEMIGGRSVDRTALVTVNGTEAAVVTSTNSEQQQHSEERHTTRGTRRSPRLSAADKGHEPQKANGDVGSNGDLRNHEPAVLNKVLHSGLSSPKEGDAKASSSPQVFSPTQYHSFTWEAPNKRVKKELTPAGAEGCDEDDDRITRSISDSTKKRNVPSRPRKRAQSSPRRLRRGMPNTIRSGLPANRLISPPAKIAPPPQPSSNEEEPEMVAGVEKIRVQETVEVSPAVAVVENQSLGISEATPPRAGPVTDDDFKDSALHKDILMKLGQPPPLVVRRRLRDPVSGVIASASIRPSLSFIRKARSGMVRQAVEKINKDALSERNDRNSTVTVAEFSTSVRSKLAGGVGVAGSVQTRKLRSGATMPGRSSMYSSISTEQTNVDGPSKMQTRSSTARRSEQPVSSYAVRHTKQQPVTSCPQ